jgi:hypothetical protein
MDTLAILPFHFIRRLCYEKAERTGTYEYVRTRIDGYLTFLMIFAAYFDGDQKQTKFHE